MLALMFFSVFSASASLEVGTFNIRNFDKTGVNTNKQLLKNMLKKLNPDLLAVQEIYDDSSFRAFLNKFFPNYDLVLSHCGGGGNQKLGFIYKKEAVTLLSYEEDARLSNSIDTGCGSLRPALIAFFQDRESKEKFAALSLHLKAGSGTRNFDRRAKQYELVQEIFGELKARGFKDIVAMGDFNTTGYIRKNEDFRNFKALLNAADAQTSAEEVGCTSYWSGEDWSDGIEESSVLDHIVYTKNFLGGALGAPQVGGHCQAAQCRDVFEDVLGETYQSVSDHCPVSLSF